MFGSLNYSFVFVTCIFIIPSYQWKCYDVILNIWCKNSISFAIQCFDIVVDKVKKKIRIGIYHGIFIVDILCGFFCSEPFGFRIKNSRKKWNVAENFPHRYDDDNRGVNRSGDKKPHSFWGGEFNLTRSRIFANIRQPWFKISIFLDVTSEFRMPTPVKWV